MAIKATIGSISEGTLRTEDLIDALEYRTIDTSTLAGLKEAEKLHAQGWHIVRTGLFLVWFQRRKCRNK